LSYHEILEKSDNVAARLKIQNKLQFEVQNFKQYKILYFKLESHLTFTKQNLWRSLRELCTNFDVGLKSIPYFSATKFDKNPNATQPLHKPVTVYFYQHFIHSHSTKGCTCVRKKYLLNSCYQIAVNNVICSYLIWQNYNPCSRLFFWGFIGDKTLPGANLSTSVHVEQQKFQHPTLLQMRSVTKWMLGSNIGPLLYFRGNSRIGSQLISW
jgi:hypothetical protein